MAVTHVGGAGLSPEGLQGGQAHLQGVGLARQAARQRVGDARGMARISGSAQSQQDLQQDSTIQRSLRPLSRPNWIPPLPHPSSLTEITGANRAVRLISPLSEPSSPCE